MASSLEIFADYLQFPEETFFAAEDNFLSELPSNISLINFFGISISAPKKIDTTAHKDLPLILASQERGVRSWAVSRRESCALIATNMDTREVFFGEPFLDEDVSELPPEIEHADPPELREEELAAIITNVVRVNAQEFLRLPWQESRYRLCVVVFDWISNSVEISLEGLAHNDTAEAATLSNLRQLIEPAKSANGFLPTYLKVSSSPPIKTGSYPAAEFKVTPQREAETQLLVSGSFSVIADETHLPFVAYKLPEIGGVDKNVAAVVPVTLALFAKNNSFPYRFDWKIPIYSESPIRPGDRIEGYFSLDAFRGTEYYLISGDYVAYLIIDGHIFGPTSYCIT